MVEDRAASWTGQCAHCAARFSTAWELVEHEKTHAGRDAKADLTAMGIMMAQASARRDAYIVKMEAEIARLRLALKLIADFRPTPDECRPPHSQIAVFARSIATETLAEVRPL